MLLLVSSPFKTNLLRNPWGMRSPTGDIKVENSQSPEVKRTN